MAITGLKRIVVGLDGSALAEAALPYAEAFAAANQAALVLVRAVHDSHAPNGDSDHHHEALKSAQSSDPVEINYPTTRRLVQETEIYLAEVAGRLRDEGLLVEVSAVIGEPAKILVEEARLRNAEMIVLATHGRSGFGRWINGSVTTRVMRDAPVPVLLVPPACRLPWPPKHTLPAATAIDSSRHLSHVTGG